jgi:hypothetical protein
VVFLEVLRWRFGCVLGNVLGCVLVVSWLCLGCVWLCRVVLWWCLGGIHGGVLVCVLVVLLWRLWLCFWCCVG